MPAASAGMAGERLKLRAAMAAILRNINAHIRVSCRSTAALSDRSRW
jgi:hypothetical protein